MPNIWEHPSVIAAEALTHLEDALVITKTASVDKTSEFTTRANGWKKGDVVPFRTNGEYEVNDFAGSIVTQPITTSTRPMMIEKFFDISVEVTAREETMDLDSFSEQVLRPASYKLAEKVDTYVGSKIQEAAGLYVSTGGLFTSASDVALARKTAILQQLAMNRFAMCDLDLEAVLLGQTWFNQSQTRGAAGTTTLQSGTMGGVMGMDFSSSIAFPSLNFTAGNGTALTDNSTAGTNMTGLKVLTIQGGSGALNAGDRLIVTGLRRPLKVATAVADLSLVTTVALTDPITEIIKGNSAITVVGSGSTFDIQGAIFDSRSLAVAFPMLDLPGDKISAAASNNGVSMRIVKGYDMNNKINTMSIDLLCGSFALDPRRITLLAG